ncbi:MAG: N-acetylmuramoyl-L-alanine amidase [Clostridia bacterium]|nr:N-acetylmuramoyl-L-alanine amidase [Clostridia bacterium]
MKNKRTWTRGDFIRTALIIVLAGVIVCEGVYLIRSNRKGVEPDTDINIAAVSIEKAEDTAKDDAETEVPTDAAPPAEMSMGGETQTVTSGNKIIVIDPGHGKSSSLMSADEKISSGWKQNSSGAWGEWRHYKTGSVNTDCEGTGCNHRVTPNGACWYPIGNGDRATEPEVNLNNALAAKTHLESMGYTVRMTRTTNNENPSITKRLSYCYPNNNTATSPDATLFLCIHSNAGGGRGTSYISLEDPYDQQWISSTYTADGNRLGQLCNDRIAETTSLTKGAPITFEPQLIAFCKAPVTCGYLEIGFFDNQQDLSILRSESDAIGRAIAEGIDSFIKGN